MIHLFKHAKDGKFDIALVVKGKYIAGSNQHYERKSGCYRAVQSLIKNCFKAVGGCVVSIQDDTVTPSKVCL